MKPRILSGGIPARTGRAVVIQNGQPVPVARRYAIIAGIPYLINKFVARRRSTAPGGEISTSVDWGNIPAQSIFYVNTMFKRGARVSYVNSNTAYTGYVSTYIMKPHAIGIREAPEGAPTASGTPAYNWAGIALEWMANIYNVSRYAFQGDSAGQRNLFCEQSVGGLLSASTATDFNNWTTTGLNDQFELDARWKIAQLQIRFPTAGPGGITMWAGLDNEPDNNDSAGTGYIWMRLGVSGRASKSTIISRAVRLAWLTYDQLKVNPLYTAQGAAIHGGAIAGGAFAWPNLSGGSGYNANMLYATDELLTAFNGKILEFWDAIDFHPHHQVGCRVEEFDGTPPAPQVSCCYNVAKALELGNAARAAASLPRINIPLIAMELGFGRWKSIGPLLTDGTDDVDLTTLRTWRLAMQRSTLARYAVKGWNVFCVAYTGAIATGMNFSKPDSPTSSSTFTELQEWENLSDLLEPIQYGIEFFPQGQFGSKLIDDYWIPVSWFVRWDSEWAPGSRNPLPYPPTWSQTTFQGDTVTITPGAECTLERILALHALRPHTFTVDIFCGSGANAFVAARGFDATNGLAISQSSTVSGGSTWTTVSVQWTPVQHGKAMIPDGIETVLCCHADGGGTVKFRNPRVSIG